MKKGLLKALCITALVAVAGVGGLALGAEISNGFEKTYSESAYENYGNEQQQIGYDKGHQDGHDEGYKEGQQAGYDSGFEAGQIYRDPEKTYLEDVFNGYNVNIVKIDDQIFLSSDSSDLLGLYKLNSDGSVTQIYNSGYGWEYFYKVKNGNIIISGQSSECGVLIYDVNLGNVYLSYESGRGWGNFFETIDGNVLITNAKNLPTNRSAEGLLLYDIQTNSISQVIDTGCAWKNFFGLSNGNVLVGNGSSAEKSGLVLYDINTRTATQIYFSGYYWEYFFEFSNGNVLIVSSNSSDSKLLLFNTFTNEISSIDSESSYSIAYQIKNDNVILSGRRSSHVGLYIYDYNSNIVDVLYNDGYYWDTFVPDENGVTISSSVNTAQGSLYYDYSTGSVTPVTEEESSYENLTMPYSEFKAKMVDDDFYIFNSKDKTQFNQVVTTYNLLDSIAFRKTASEENGNKKSTYEIYCFYGTEEEAKAVNMWTYDYDGAVADSLFGEAENSEFTEVNAKIMLEGVFTIFLNGQDINIEAYDGSSLLLFDVSEIEEALSVNL